MGITFPLARVSGQVFVCERACALTQVKQLGTPRDSSRGLVRADLDLCQGAMSSVEAVSMRRTLQRRMAGGATMGDRSAPPQPSGPGRFAPWLWPLVVMLVMLAFYLSDHRPPEPAVRVVPYSEVKALIRADAVRAVVLESDEISALLRRPEPDGPETLRAVTPAQPDPDLLPLLEERGVEVTAVAARDDSMLIAWLPWLVLIGVYIWLSRRLVSGAGGLPGGAGGL
jgi:hypothetical protein